MLSRLLIPSLIAFAPVAICTFAWPQKQTQRSPHGHQDERFTSSEQCAVCHSPAPGATAMWSDSGDDISPYGLWQATMMANSFRDPYFRAQLMKESQAGGEHVQELCLRCHAPMVHHEVTRDGGKAPRLADVDGDPFADDGVSCTVCHMIDSKGLGDESTFSGKPNFTDQRQIFGPFEEPATGPMQNLVDYTPTHAPHISSSAMCATCHTLYTSHHGTPFAEQTPYLEWRNSEFSDEEGRTDKSKSCQECHMPDLGSARIARNPAGFDFNIPVREGYRGHSFVGGNAFMVAMLQAHREELDVIAEEAALARVVAATRKQLAEKTAKIEISEIERADGMARFSVNIENLTGHKFPTGYPARRAWLHVRVSSGRQQIFETGTFDEDGRLTAVEDPLRVPHVRTVRKPSDVVIYEMVANDPEGEPTTFLTKMVVRAKDNRLLPRGWNAAGPHVGDTFPVGTRGDDDFVGGGDTVDFEIPLPENASGRLRVVARMFYQPIPPVWVDALRSVDADEARRFVGYYEVADKTPDLVGLHIRLEQ